MLKEEIFQSKQSKILKYFGTNVSVLISGYQLIEFKSQWHTAVIVRSLEIHIIHRQNSYLNSSFLRYL